MTEFFGEVGVVEVATFDKGRESVVVKDGGPGIAVVSRIVAGGEDVLEVGALVAADDFGDETDAVEIVGFEGVGVDGLLRGDAVVGHVEQGGSEEFGVDESLAIGLGSGNLGDEFVGDALTGLVMLGIGFHDLRVAAPVFHYLRGELNEIARNIGASQRGIVAFAEESVEGVAEFVEEGFALVEIEQGGFVGCGFGEVADHLDDGDDVVAVAVDFLAAEFGHPSTAALAGTRMEIHVENADNLVSVENFVGMGILVVGGKGAVFAEGNAVEFVGSGEGAFTNIVEGEVGTDEVVVEVVFLFAEFFAIVTPIPRLKGGTGDVFLNHFLVFSAFLFCFGKGGAPNLHEAGINSLGSLGKAIVEDIVGVGFEAEDVSTFETEIGEGVDNLCVVVVATVAAGCVGLPHLMTEVTVGAVLHEWFPAGKVESEDEFALGSGVGIGSLAGGSDLVGGETGRGGVKYQLIGVGGLKDVLGKTKGEGSYLLVELAETCLLIGRDIGAAADKAFIGFLEETLLLGIEVEALALVVDSLDALEEFGVKGDVVAVGGEFGGYLFGDGFHLVAVFTLAEVEEDTGDLVEKLAAVLVGFDGVLEGGRVGVVDDGIDFGQLLFHALLEGRHVVFGLDF